MACWVRSFLGVWVAAFLSGPAAAAAAEAVDLELVIATDVSYSINEDEARLQRQGIATAFLSREVVSAIRSGILGRIAVAYLDYSSRPYNEVVIDWRVIHDQASAAAFAEALLKAQTGSGRHTSISDAIEQAAQMIETNAYQGTRRVIDVSGDGPNNWGRLVSQVRDETTARRITINGLPILNPADAYMSRYYLPDLDDYYRGCVIGGAGAFIVVAHDFKDYARAIRRKLVLEIARSAPEGTNKGIRRAAARLAQAGPGSGYVYPKGCDIGERMRGGQWGPFEEP